ncbi:MAG: DNA-processing protein DprA, partial [Hyphomicrobiaceae bacterium]
MSERDAKDIFAAAPLPVAPLDDAQRLACLRLIRSENVGPATFRALINHYGGAGPALTALPEMARRSGRARPIRICTKAEAEAELEAVARAGAQVLFTIEPGYPAPLAFVDGAPPMLYAKGRTGLLNRSAVAVVGSRSASAAGQQLARTIAGEIGTAGHAVVSGLARGIDTAAHKGALSTGTIAVLAGGADVVYPRENQALYDAIVAEGCVIAEQPIGFQARAQDFPRRNRVISGVSRAIVVVEAARRSGSLITARLAG